MRVLRLPLRVRRAGSAAALKILQASSTTGAGGGAVYVAGLCRLLAERGHEVHAAVPPDSPLHARLAAQGVPCRAFMLPHSFSPRGIAALVRIVREGGYDLIHGHSGSAYRACCLASRLARTPLVLSKHHFRTRRKGPLWRAMMRRVPRVLVPTERLRADVVRAYRLSPERVVAIPGWVDGERFSGVARPTGPPVVGMLGSFVPVKGHEDFVRMAGLVARERKDVAFHAVGLDEKARPAYVARLQALRDSLGLGDRLRLSPWVADSRDVFAELSALVVPSHGEAFGLVVVEAMAAGVPVVAYDVGGPGEILKGGRGGLLAPARDVEALARAVGRVLDDPALATRLSEEGRSEARERYSPSRVVDRILAEYAAAAG